MEHLAPDAEVIKTSWYSGSQVTRKQRFRYAITGHIDNDTIKKYPQLDVDSECGSLVTMVNELSKYAHISSGTYGLQDKMVEEFRNDIEDVVCEYARKFVGTKDSIQEIIWEILQDEITERITNEIPDELDVLSSQTCVYYAAVEDIDDFSVDGSDFELSGDGYVEAQLNYGGSKDGVSIDDSYPLMFTASIRAADLSVQDVHIEVDNSSFYK
jgi:hypothetical protein